MLTRVPPATGPYTGRTDVTAAGVIVVVVMTTASVAAVVAAAAPLADRDARQDTSKAIAAIHRATTVT